MAKNNNKKSKGEPQTEEQKNGGLYSNIMNDFFDSSPDAEDAEGRSIKQAFQGNMAQSVLDSQLSKDLGQFNAGIAQQNMTHQADLEQRNQSALMKDEFNYGMESMDAQFKYGEQGAQNQHKRDLGMLSATGHQQRLNIGAQGNQDRLTRIVDGEQTRLTAHVNNASAERRQTGMNEANKYIQDSASNAQRDVATTQKDAAVQTTGMKTQADIDIAGIEKDSALGVQGLVSASADKASDNAKEANMYGADKSVDIANIGAKGTIDNTKETGNQTRLTMGTENQLKAKDRADMHRYARNTARAM
jgi:hypothetical protein